MLLIMVGNMASIFTQVYIAKVTSIYSFFPHLLHTVPFTSLSLLWAHVDIFMVIFICSCHRPNVQWGFCLPFSRWKYQQSIPVQSQVRSQDEHTSFWFALLKSCSTKCRHSLCWCSQNTRACTSMLWLRSQPTSYFMCIWSWQSTPFMYLLYSWMFCGWFTWITLLPNLLSVWTNISWVWICDKSYNSIVLPNSGNQVWAAILVWFVSTMDHFTRFTNTLWKILLIHSYCPIAVCFTSQQVLQ